MSGGDITVRKRRTTVTFTALACGLIALLLPAVASAAPQTFIVNTTGDGTDTAACTAPGVGTECTLRAAILAANATAEADTIHFDHSIFGGSTAAVIPITEGLPTIEHPVTIDAEECLTAYNVEGPCAEVISSATAENVFTVDVGLSTIRGLAINGGKNGIALESATHLFFAQNDWFGVELDHTFGGRIANAGILVEPGAKNAVIGGTEPDDRNVFGESDVGVYIDGASENQVLGNFIGVKPDRSFSAGHSLTVGVRIVDSIAPALVSKAEFNNVGGELLAAEVASAECDGPCNVIATEEGPEEEGTGIDLGDIGGTPADHVEAATGPTTITGNYLGLSVDGTTELQSRSIQGVFAGPAPGTTRGPGQVTIGGVNPTAERNYFIGGEYGVFAEGAEELSVVGNKFGYPHNGERKFELAAQEDAIFVSSEGLAKGAFIVGNAINSERHRGIQSNFAGSEIFGNNIVGGTPAIRTAEDTEGVGNQIQGNILTEPETTGIYIGNSGNTIGANAVTEAADAGIQIEGPGPGEWVESNVVTGNAINKAAEIGIEVGSNATHDRIGGDGPGEANIIDECGGAGSRDGAITIVSRTEGRTEVAANTGFGNSPKFIKLISHGGPEKPNGGIQPPALTTVLRSSATGTAEPKATVRIFSKASPETGELGALLAVVKADAAGNWSAAYATVGVGTLVAATQTDTESATSEVSAAAAASADPATPEEPKTNQPAPSIPPPTQPPTPKAPKVTITAKPKKSSTNTTAKFKFKAEPAAGAKFECKLDNAKWARCSSPKTYKELAVGKHIFRVRAEANGLTSAVAKYEFKIKS